MPKAIYDALLLGGQPIYQYVFVLLIAFELVLLWTGANNWRWQVWVPMGVALAATGLGSILYVGDCLTSTFTIMYDGSCIAAGVGGLLLGMNLSARHAKNLFLLVQFACVLSLFVIGYLLRGGYIEQATEGTRVFDESMFFSSTIAAVLLPVGVFALCERGLALLAWAQLVTSLAAGFWFAEMSATRSVLLLNAVSVGAALWLLGRTIGQRVAIFGSAGLACGLVLLFIGGQDSPIANLTSRLTEEGFSSAARGDEALLMFDQLGSRLLTGIGVGGGYFGGIVYKDNPLGISFAPHIGILTPLLKGGILALGALVVWPVVALFRGLFSGRTAPYTRAVLLSLMVYLVLASISGGYYYGNLVFVALLVGQCHSVNGLKKVEATSRHDKNIRIRTPRSVSQ